MEWKKDIASVVVKSWCDILFLDISLDKIPKKA